MPVKRIFLIVLDSVGIGAAPDAADFGDEGSNTLYAATGLRPGALPCLERLGLYQIDGLGGQPHEFSGCIARMREASRGKDTTIGHWEIGGVISNTPLPVFPNGFPEELLAQFSRRCGRGVLCNRPYSGTDVIRDFGPEHERTGKLIVYTSADSVFQVAAHEDVVALKELYLCCETARELLCGEYAVGRVIARPFSGVYPQYVRTAGRHDYSLPPPAPTMLDTLFEAGLTVAGIGKIGDIFAGRGLTQSTPTTDNRAGMRALEEAAAQPFTGLCFANLVDFDMKYGHRNDATGYGRALAEFDAWLGAFLPRLRPEDALFITADHGCDPSTPSTDHSREYTPFLAYGSALRRGVNLGTRASFADIGCTVLDCFGLPAAPAGESFWRQIYCG